MHNPAEIKINGKTEFIKIVMNNRTPRSYYCLFIIFMVSFDLSIYHNHICLH